MIRAGNLASKVPGKTVDGEVSNWRHKATEWLFGELGEVAGLMCASATKHSRSWVSMAEAVHTAGAWPVSTQDQEEKLLPPSMSLQCPDKA